jgi:putative iron-dependent peroxidase
MASREKSQPGITSETTAAALFLTLVCRPKSAARAVAAKCAGLPRLVGQLCGGDRTDRLDFAVGFGAGFWRALATGKAPAELRTFRPINGPGGRAPATQADVFLHLKSNRADLNLECARRFLQSLDGMVRAVEEVHGFSYLDSRDFTGFIDGTANPRGRERGQVALIGKEDPAFSGGSYGLTQRYVHDLARWAGLSTRKQEAVIGRTKQDSRELKHAPPTAHIRRAEVEAEGQELAIVRQSMPYGLASGEMGLYFVAYAKDLHRLDAMLRRLMGSSGDGLHDRLMEYTRPESGAYFFFPSLALLRSFQ